MSVSVEIKTRPIRLAFLVDPNNSEQVGEAIRLSSTLWGGVYFPIIELCKRIPSAWKEKPLPEHPLAERPSARSIVLGYINAFDPDFLVQLSKNVPRYVRDLGIKTIQSGDLWGDLNQQGKPPPNLGIGLFEILDRILEEDSPGVRIAFPKKTQELSLFWASVFGDIPDELDSLLEYYCQERLEVSRSFLSNENALGYMTAPNILFPLRTVSRYMRICGPVSDGGPNIFFMDGKKVGDIVDFWNLRAMGKPILPVPRQLKEDPRLRKAVNHFLKWPRPSENSAGVAQIPSPGARMLRARNCSMKEMREYASAFDGASLELKDAYPKIWSAGSNDAIPCDVYGEDGIFTNPPDAAQEQVRIRPTLPEFRFSNHRRYICANEITIHSFWGSELVAEAFPRSSGENFARAVSGSALRTKDWRGGRNGLVRLVGNGFDQPREIPLSERVFLAWLRDLGWKVELSSAGLLAKRIHEKLGDSVSRLKDRKLLGLLEHMNGGSVRQDGTPLDGNKISHEREISVAEVKERLKRKKRYGKSLYDYLTQKGFFRLGARVKCPNCFRHSWYSLESIGDSFACPKCLDTFAAVGNLDGGGKSPWYYKTAGPFSIPNYADGAYTVLLTLDFFYRLRLISHSFRITPVMSFKAESPDGKTVEADFAAFWKSGTHGSKVELLLGECKTYGKFEDKDFKRMRYLSKTFPNPVLVFSTLRESLENEERKKIARLASTVPVMVLTARELCPYSGVDDPKGSQDNRSLDYGSSLADICRITQISYVGLGDGNHPDK